MCDSYPVLRFSVVCESMNNNGNAVVAGGYCGAVILLVHPHDIHSWQELLYRTKRFLRLHS